MPHQCVRCNTFFADSQNGMLEGCACGGKLFFYIKKEKIEQARDFTQNLTKKDIDQIEKDVFDLVDAENEDDAVVLDIETVRILAPGKYEIDLVQLFKNEPLVYKMDEGKYVIDIIKSFTPKRKK